MSIHSISWTGLDSLVILCLLLFLGGTSLISSNVMDGDWAIVLFALKLTFGLSLGNAVDEIEDSILLDLGLLDCRLSCGFDLVAFRGVHEASWLIFISCSSGGSLDDWTRSRKNPSICSDIGSAFFFWHTGHSHFGFFSFIMR